MIIFLLAFIFSAAGLVAMVFVRLWQIESGRIRVRNGAGFPYSLFVEEVAGKVRDALKRLSLIFAAKSLYFASRVFDWAKGVTRRQVVRMERKLVQEKTATSKRQGAVSLFLKDIAEHKKVMKVKLRRRAKVETGEEAKENQSPVTSD